MSALIVEILSPSNSDQDLDVKRNVYARAGLPEYWIVRQAERDVLVCSRPDQALDASPTLPVREPIAPFFTGAPDPTP